MTKVVVLWQSLFLVLSMISENKTQNDFTPHLVNPGPRGHTYKLDAISATIATMLTGV